MVIIPFESSMRKPDTVAFIDVENFGKASRIPALIQAIYPYGNRLSILAYGVPFGSQPHFESSGCSVIPKAAMCQHKNFVDQQIALDAFELAFRFKSIKTVVLATGDADFVPLVIKLKTLEKRVVQVGGGDSVSKSLVNSADHAHRIGRREQCEAFLNSPWPSLIVRKLLQLLKTKFYALGVNLAELGNAMKTDFNFRPYREFGLKWKEVCHLLQNHGLILNSEGNVDVLPRSSKYRSA
jgi:hypothetical protein